MRPKRRRSFLARWARLESFEAVQRVPRQPVTLRSASLSPPLPPPLPPPFCRRFQRLLHFSQVLVAMNT
eukprot:g16352.t1